MPSRELEHLRDAFSDMVDKLRGAREAIARQVEEERRMREEVELLQQQIIRQERLAAIGVLLQEGIGDTIRYSLTPEPGGDRSVEVKASQELLQTMGFRTFVPMVAACPGCGRTTSTVFQELADNIQTFLRDSMPEWKKLYPGVEAMNVAVMGCIVNGPGESKHANIGISLPGTGESPAAPVFVDGQKVATLRGERIVDEFQTIVLDYVKKNYGQQTTIA